MTTHEQDQKFRRDTIQEIDREYGRARERDRIVAILKYDIAAHEQLAAKYADRNNIPAWQAEMFGAQVLAVALEKILK